MPRRKYRISDEARQVARERMQAMWAKRRGESLTTLSQEPVAQTYVRPPEVEAILETMSPERRAQLAMRQSQAQALGNGRVDGQQNAEAMRRYEENKAAHLAALSATATMTREQVAEGRDERRVGSRELNIIVRTDGMMVSRDGPCVCGRPRREWHAVCLRQEAEKVLAT